MFKNSGAYAKTYIALLAYIAGVVPVVITFHTWQQIVAYVVPGLLAVLGVNIVPNTPQSFVPTAVVAPPPPTAEAIAAQLHT